MKNDFLKECMSDVGAMPIDEFNKHFCMRCNNNQCDRARVNNHIFVKRVTNWKENLFDNVQRADDDDPKYAQIRSIRFIPKNPSLGNILSRPTPAPIPPSTVEEPKSEPVVATPEPVFVPPNDDEPEATSSDDEPSEPAPAPSPSQPQPTVVKNTPFQQGYIMEEKKDPGVLPVGGTFVFDDE